MCNICWPMTDKNIYLTDFNYTMFWTRNKSFTEYGLNTRNVLSCSVMSNSSWPHGLKPARILCSWDSPGKNTRVGCFVLLQGIFPMQGSNPGFPHFRQILYRLSHQPFHSPLSPSSRGSLVALCFLP